MPDLFFLPSICNFRRVISREQDDATWQRLRVSAPQLAAKIERDPESGCWVWLAASDLNGYGCMTRGGRMGKAHRFIYELLIGPITDGLYLDHLCVRPACVNPVHLEPVTPAVNTQRATRPVRTHCRDGHELERARSGRLFCRVCRNNYSRAWYRQRTAGVAVRERRAPCGSVKGYVRHLEDREPPCFKCRSAEDRRQAKAASS